MRGISDPSQRDVIPIGSVLKRTLMQTQRVGVLMMDVDDLGDVNEILDSTGLKSILHGGTFGPTAGVSTWTGYSAGGMAKGFLGSERVGNEIRIRGIEVFLQVQLVSEEGGTMVETSPTTWTTTSAMNGPCKFRFLAVINDKNAVGSSAAATQIFDAPTICSTAISTKTIFQGYSIVFDKSYVLSAEGDQIIDHIFIDCDFIQYYGIDTDYPIRNDLEFWYFLDDSEFGDPVFKLELRRWFYDN